LKLVFVMGLLKFCSFAFQLGGALLHLGSLLFQFGGAVFQSVGCVAPTTGTAARSAKIIIFINFFDYNNVINC